jgi:hypothetical protein
VSYEEKASSREKEKGERAKTTEEKRKMDLTIQAV